ncbi:hypothetical protein [Nocardioides yefusunii]|uniref:Uncharacterized protein n=1 Tax=Nocardioides yefusunii TaxID=2500546 RepID=A0ABW1QXY5_9ACTN|nr:hypothetical protein [Nocardioides yefusunii]
MTAIDLTTGFSRRAVTRAAVWTVPAVSIAAASPAFASSDGYELGALRLGVVPSDAEWGNGATRQFTLSVTKTGVAVPAGSVIRFEVVPRDVADYWAPVWDRPDSVVLATVPAGAAVLSSELLPRNEDLLALLADPADPAPTKDDDLATSWAESAGRWSWVLGDIPAGRVSLTFTVVLTQQTFWGADGQVVEWKAVFSPPADAAPSNVFAPEVVGVALALTSVDVG